MDQQDIEVQAQSLMAQALGLTVANDAEYVAAGEFIVGCKQLSATIKTFFKPMKDAAFAAHKAVCEKETAALGPVTNAMQVAGETALVWKREQDRIAAEENRKRYEAERLAREEAKLKEAELLEKWGDDKGAAAKLHEATIPPRPTKIESTIPKVAGLSTQKKWKARVTRPNEVKREYCAPDDKLINIKVAQWFAYNTRATDAEIAEFAASIGGIELYQDEGFRVRA